MTEALGDARSQLRLLVGRRDSGRARVRAL